MKILLPVDRAEHARAACDLIRELFDEGTVLFLHVIDPAEASYSAEAGVPNISDGWYEQERARAEDQFEELAKSLEAHGLETKSVVKVGKPSQTIVDTAKEEAVDHIVMGSHSRKGVSRILLGSVAETVVRRSPVPVTVARTKTDD